MRVCRARPKAKPNQAMGYSRKNPSRGGWMRTYFSEKIPRFFRFVTLPLEILEKTKLHPWKFHKMLLHPLEILLEFFLSPLEIPLLFYLNPVISSTYSFFIQYSWKFHVLDPPCCLDFFWNGSITELWVVVLFSQKYYWGLCTKLDT